MIKETSAVEFTATNVAIHFNLQGTGYSFVMVNL